MTVRLDMAKPAGPPSSSAAPPGKEEEEQKNKSGGGNNKKRRRRGGGGKGASTLVKRVVEAWAEDSLDLRRFQGKRVRPSVADRPLLLCFLEGCGVPACVWWYPVTCVFGTLFFFVVVGRFVGPCGEYFPFALPGGDSAMINER